MKMNNKMVGLWIGLVAIVSFFGLALWWVLSPGWTVLYGNEVTPESYGEVVKALDNWRVDYKIEEETGQLSVRDELVIETRERLAAEGLPSGASVGLEIFSNSEYGLSEFVQNVNYKRAIENELSKTIRSLDVVKSARVHITLKKESIFREKNQLSKASVILDLKLGENISKAQVRGIREIVSSSVEGLEVENVVVLDQNGVLISSTDGNDYFFGDTPNDYEKNIKTKVLTVVSGFVGASVPIDVVVTVDIDFKKEVTLADRIVPKNEKGDGFLSSVHTQNRSLEADSSEANRNITDERKYIFSREKSEIHTYSPAVRKISVAVVLGGAVTEDDIRVLKDLVVSAAALNLSRGDQYSVVSTASKAIEPEKMELATAQTPIFETAVDSDPMLSTARMDTGIDYSMGNSFLEMAKSLYLSIVLLLVAIISILIVLFERRRTKHVVKRLSSEERVHILNELEHWMKS